MASAKRQTSGAPSRRNCISTRGSLDLLQRIALSRSKSKTCSEAKTKKNSRRFRVIRVICGYSSLFLLRTAVQMNDLSCRRFGARDFNEVALKRFPLGVPELIAFLGDDPSDFGIETVEVRPPVFLVHFVHEAAHGNARRPHGDVNDPCVGHHETVFVMQGLHIGLQLLGNLDERRHPEALVVDCLGIEEVTSELLIDRFIACGRNRIRQKKWGEQKQRVGAVLIHLPYDEKDKHGSKQRNGRSQDASITNVQ